MDQVIRSELHYQDHTGVLTHKTTQPTENLILARNAELRKSPGALYDLGEQAGETYGRMVATIPLIMWEKALRDGYDLNSRDRHTAETEMVRFFASNDGKLCLVQGK